MSELVKWAQGNLMFAAFLAVAVASATYGFLEVNVIGPLRESGAEAGKLYDANQAKKIFRVADKVRFAQVKTKERDWRLEDVQGVLRQAQDDAADSEAFLNYRDLFQDAHNEIAKAPNDGDAIRLVIDGLLRDLHNSL